MPSAATSTLLRLIVVVGVASLTTACSTSDVLGTNDDERFRQAAINLIEVDLAPQIGLGPLVASCEGNGLEPGATFACDASPATASSEAEPIRFDAVVGPDGSAVDVTSTNLLLSQQVEQIEATAATVLAPRVAWTPQADDVECADRSIALDEQMRLICVVVDSGSTDDSADDIRYPASIKIEDITTLRITVTLESAQN